MQRREVRFLLAVGLGIALGGAGCGGGGGAATFVVTNLEDAGPGSLRQAIAAAGPGDAITFADGLSGSIGLTTGPLDLAEDLRILGPTSSTIGVDGGGALGCFTVAGSASVLIQDLEITNGSAGTGGGLLNRGTVTLRRVLIEDCEALSLGVGTGDGGGLHNDGGTMTLVECEILDCIAYGGGAIFNDEGSLLVRRSTLWSNEADDQGGALWNHAGTATLVNTTIAGNDATGPGDDGGGIASTAGSDDALLRLISCTLAGNEAVGDGGGIYLRENLVAPATESRLVLRNTILGANSASSGPDVYGVEGTVVSEGHNVVGDGTASTLFNGLNGDQIGDFLTPIDLAFTPLGDQGGPTPTVGIGAASPAVDAVPIADCTDADGSPLPADQRGVVRPQGAACDAGAFER